MSHEQKPLLTDLLRDVSRSFYLTLRVLPAKIRPPIGLAYLLARTTDTIADTDVLPLDQRLDSLAQLRERILGNAQTIPDFHDLAQRQSLPEERALLERCGETLSVLESFTPADRQLIREVLGVIASGQELDLQRFAGASEKNIVALTTDAELEDYTYRVAGCVGEFWTKICRAHLFPDAPLDETTLLGNAVRFGKGLQLVNILRDVPVDLRHGRCYLPSQELSAVGLSAADLLEPANESKLRPLYHRYLTIAEGHLAAGWAYTNSLPRGCIRLRLACAWPILIGMKTLALLRSGNVLDPGCRIKVSRPEVKRLIIRSILCYPWPGAWRKLFPAPIAI
jgi:farnesyl-diphosphate farnesyltransferase